MDGQRPKNVCVVVLGDIGTSPRMQYHSLSLANAGYDVNIIGYNQSKLASSVRNHSNINIHPLLQVPTISFSKLLNYTVKTIWQAFTLLCALSLKNADYVLLQNPPAVPTIPVCYFYCLLTRAKLIVDWHNYANTIMALNIGKKHLLVKITKWIEFYFGSKADAHLCVTNAMKSDLEEKRKISAVTLYDRPAEIFRSITLREKHEFLMKIGKQYHQFQVEDDNKTVMTEEDELGNIQLKKDRPALIISSTSWTKDEDFGLLLEALKEYEKSYENDNLQKLPELLCVITGKGPLKDYYLKKMKQENFKHVKIITPWLEFSDYPLMLASADLGICLHNSSSGLDLPMKVVDMFGCGIPVCALDFKCLHELVRHEQNSYTFENHEKLASTLSNWFTEFPENNSQKELEKKFKREINKFREVRWDDNWTKNALPLFKT